LANDIYHLFKKAGFTPVLIDTPVNSLIKYSAKYMKDHILEQSKKKIFLNLGASAIDMVVLQGKTPVSQQVINFNSQRIDVIISNTFNTDRFEAEQLKIRYGLDALYNTDASEISRTVASIINNQLDTMMGDLYRRIHEHITGAAENPVSEIIMTGGLAGIVGFDRYLSQAFATPCKIINTEKLIRVSVKKPQSDSDSLNKNDIRLFTGIAGAAFRGE
jgi:Tfp pilus assembly PilM family ATPase